MKLKNYVFTTCFIRDSLKGILPKDARIISSRVEYSNTPVMILTVESEDFNDLLEGESIPVNNEKSK